MHLLDPAQLSQGQADSVKAAFVPLLGRNVVNVADELENADRQLFDDAVIAAFGLQIDRQRIYDALLSLVEIRRTATE